MVVFFAVALLTVIVCASGVDRWTTLDPWTWFYPLRAACGATVAGLTAFLGVRGYFFPPAGTALQEKIAQLKRDNYFSWFARGAMATAAIALMMGWCCVRVASVGAQYLDGREDSFDATVTSIYSGSRSACTRYLIVRRDGDAARLQICLVTWYRHSLASGVLAVDEPVTIRVVVTALGVVVKSVRPKQ